MPNPDGSLQAREFLFFTEDLALAGLPAGFETPERKLMWTILQFYYEDPLVHFELQPIMGRGWVELGLHFEGEAEANEAAAHEIAAHAPLIRAALGPEWEMEEWTASWRRLHRPFHFEKLTTSLGRQVAEQMAQAILTLSPLMRHLRVSPPPRERAARPERANTRERWRQKARRQ